MKKILLVGGIIFAFSLFIIFSNPPVNSNNIEISMRSTDFMDLSAKQNIVLDLHETELGNQFNSLKKPSINPTSNSLWQETNISLQGTISENNIQKNVTFDYYSKMPTPPQKVLDRFAKKAENPTLRETPFMENFGNQSTPPNDAINVDDSLDKAKKN